MEILVATNNAGKVLEIKDKLNELNLKIYSLKDKAIDVEVIEDGQTFEENALKKACELCALSGMVTIADDSGLEVDALSGAPGVYSARYAGEGASDTDLYMKLLKEMEQIPEDKRGARFVSVVALVFPDGRKFALRGECLGVITKQPKGEDGFGYDPVFWVEETGQTFAQMSLAKKNKVSHRAKALEKLLEKLKTI